MHDICVEARRVAANIARVIDHKINEVARSERHDFKKGGRIRARAASENRHAISQHIDRNRTGTERLKLTADRMHAVRCHREAQHRR